MRSALVADDDEFFRMAAAEILRQIGFQQVEEFPSLDGALDRMGELPLSMALLSSSLLGAFSLRSVREAFPEVRLAVVSNSENRQDILLALDAGVHGYLLKGLGKAQFEAALRRIVAGDTYVPPIVSDLSQRAALIEKEAGGASLTPRQWDVGNLIVYGKSNKEIARALDLGEGTVKVHVGALYRKLGVTSRSAAAVAASKLLASTHSSRSDLRH